jgi:hypothetical protein
MEDARDSVIETKLSSCENISHLSKLDSSRAL